MAIFFGHIKPGLHEQQKIDRNQGMFPSLLADAKKQIRCVNQVLFLLSEAL
jgi:hypothetical protein